MAEAEGLWGVGSLRGKQEALVKQLHESRDRPGAGDPLE